MIRQPLADHTVVYNGTVVAFTLVNGLAFFISLADPDIRCSIVSVAGATLVANMLVLIAVFSIGVPLGMYGSARDPISLVPTSGAD